MTSFGAEPTSRLVLDTSAYSQLRLGHEVVHEAVAKAESVILPATVVGELEAAFEVGGRSAENRVILTEFLEEPFVSILETDRSVARRYGQIFGQLRRAGTPIPVNDIWIAAAALDCGGRLVTFDRHFDRVPGVDLLLLS